MLGPTGSTNSSRKVVLCGSRLSGLLPIYTGREPEGGAHLAGGRGQVFQWCAGAQGDYPIAIALEGEAIYEIELWILTVSEQI